MIDDFKYTQWIDGYVRRNNDFVLGKCREACYEMTSTFPELRIRRGYVLTLWGMRGHFWCLDPNNHIVDPTVSQFPYIREYKEWKPGDMVRIGRCMNCGEGIWESLLSLETVVEKNICSEECEEEFIKSLSVDSSSSVYI